MSTNRNAGAVIFGFDYQIDAAICLFVRNIKLIAKIKVEGKYEDIEQILSNGSIIFCQVKSVVDATKDDSQTKKQKLRKALISLSDCELNTKDKLIYCSNQKDPLIAKDSKFTINDIVEFEYNSLDEESKKLINKYFKKNISNVNKLSIMKVPYNYSSDKNIKMEFIYNCVKEFLISIDGNALGYKDITLKWHEFLKDSAYDKEFYINKKDLIWIIICVILEKMISNVQISNNELLYQISERRDLILNSVMNFQIYNVLVDIYNSNIKYDKSIDEIFGQNKEQILELIFEQDKINSVDIISANIVFRSIANTSNKILKVKEACNLVNK